MGRSGDVHLALAGRFPSASSLLTVGRRLKTEVTILDDEGAVVIGSRKKQFYYQVLFRTTMINHDAASNGSFINPWPRGTH